MDAQEIKKISIAFQISESDLKKCIKKVKTSKTPAHTPLATATNNILNNAPKVSLKSKTVYFYEDDFQELNNKIEKIKKEIERLGAEIAHSVDVSGETFHDNFVYEEGGRQQAMWTQEVRKLERIRSRTKVLKFIPDNEKVVKMGKNIKLIHNGEIKLIRIGSFLNFNKDSISYASIFSQSIIGSKVGDKKTFSINQKKHSVTIEDIN